MPLIGSKYRSSARPHPFQKSRYDDACECRMAQNYWLHQPFWWRWFNRGKDYR